MVGASFRADPVRTVLAMIFYPLAYLEGPLVAFGLKLATDSALAGNFNTLFVALALIVTGLSILHMADHTAWQLALRLENNVTMSLESRIMQLTSEVAGIEQFERPEYLDRMEILRERGWLLGRSMYILPMNVADLLRAAATFYLLASVHPLLICLAAFAIPSIFVDLRSDKVLRAVEEGNADTMRRARHFYELGINPSAGKELRVFGIGNEIFKRHRREWNRMYKEEISAQKTASAHAIAGWLSFAFGFVLVLAFTTWRVLNGNASVGDLVLVFTLAAQVNRETRVSVEMMHWIRWVAQVAKHLLWLERFRNNSFDSSSTDIKTPDEITKGISLREVTFSYPGTDRKVLQDISLDIPPGSSLAIVGENGAGKSTLVKLLFRFYRPTKGAIYLDGCDIADYSLEEWRKACTAAFQDFFHFELLARETIGIGDIELIEDSSYIERAVTAADANDVILRLPNGYETQLGTRWEHGQELSIGQWQKLALARTMMRLRPLLLVMDEPTASLDPQTEHSLFTRQANAAKLSTSGAISVIVSHRFSTVAMADYIVVLDKGKVIEQGTHKALMENGGLYSELFTIQAEAYRDRGVNSPGS